MIPRNVHSVSYGTNLWGPVNPQIPSYTIYILTVRPYDMDSWNACQLATSQCHADLLG